MKNTFLFICLFFLSFKIYSQNILTIGEIRKINFNHIAYSPPIKLYLGNNLSIDANNDNISDFTISVGHSPSCSNSPSCADQWYESEVISKSSSTQFAGQYNASIAKPYSPGDTIINNVIWWESNKDVSYIALCRNWSGYHGGPNYFAKNDSTYAGFRIITSQSDTLYGWIRIKDVNYQEVIVFEFGCESSESRDTIINKVSENELLKDDIIIPNPVKNQFRICQSYNREIHDVRLIDLSGRILKVYDDKTTEYGVSELNPGVYIISFRHGNDMLMKKIVKI